MSALFGKNAGVSIGYYGGFDFLDKQKKFDNTFGTDPPIINDAPVGKFNENNTTAKQLLEFSDQCRLDVYLHACREFYVGKAKVDKNASMREVCREISLLRQDWRDSHGRLIRDTPK